jgi:hypothetical protein
MYTGTFLQGSAKPLFMHKTKQVGDQLKKYSP